ncbi:glycoside hydrolase family 3 C-terminal domain-containing protein [Nocardia sp. NBC_01377]|uniref:beta-glucosidase family protein n=1 Tax=Nocardia sp. NBC_01377 TaxID=2903595 RepID=UPI0032439D63
MIRSDTDHDAAIEAAVGRLDLDAETSLLAGRDVWSLPALPQVGLRSIVMSDGPIGVRGVRWAGDDPSVALPSPTALAATWAPDLAARAGRLLAQEARRKGVDVLLAPTVNLHRSPLGGRHFECYSEDPYLTGVIGTGFVRGVQEGGVAATVEHFVANDAETDRFTVDNAIAARPLRELYLAPFEAIVRDARPWAIMAAYNSVNGTTMTEHRELVRGVLRGEWGFDGCVVSDWLAARSTEGALRGGLDIAMPGPVTVYGAQLADAGRAGRAGRVDEADVDDVVRRVLRLAARVGALAAVPPAVPADRLPASIDGRALAREIACRGVVLVRNAELDGRPALPLEATGLRHVAVLGRAAIDARILGGGSATVYPEQVVSPLDGLTAALPDTAVTFAVGADPSDEMGEANTGFTLRAVVRDAAGEIIGTYPLPNGSITWLGEVPEGVTYDALRSVEIAGTFTPRDSGEHAFGTKGLGRHELVVDGTVLFAGTQEFSGDQLEGFFAPPVERGRVALSAGQVVVVNAGSPVAMPWRDDVAAVLLGWFPGQEAGAAPADVLLGHEEPGGRLPTTWPATLADAPVTEVAPVDGVLPYSEGVFIGYRAWDRGDTAPAYPFGHGTGYTTWEYDSICGDANTVTVRLRNTGDRHGREIVQIYLTLGDDSVPRPRRWLAGFAPVEAAAGTSVDISIPLPPRAFRDLGRDVERLDHGAGRVPDRRRPIVHRQQGRHARHAGMRSVTSRPSR